MLDLKLEEQYISENPATKEALGTFTYHNEQEMLEMIERADTAAKAWRLISAPARGEYLLKLAEIIEAESNTWTELLLNETGKCRRDAAGEVKRSVTILRFMSGEGFRLGGDTIPSTSSEILCYTLRQPLGTVGIITPWNVPLAIPIWKMAPALVAGNSIIWKSANQSLVISSKLMEAFAAAGFPEGLIQMAIGAGPEIGEILTSHEKIKAISFTGSNRTGLVLNEWCAPRGIRLQAEMGGKNPFIIMPDADLERAVADIIAGGLLDAGQRCTATSRIFVHQSIHEPFRALLVKAVSALKVGLPHLEESQIGPIVDENQYARIKAMIDKGVEEGAQMILGADHPDDEWFSKGYFIMPTIFDQVTQEMTIAREEIFGPVLAILTFEDFDSCLEQANDVKYGLSSSIYTRDLSFAMKYIHTIESGMVHVNLPSVYSEPQMPFGGIKATGIGGFREMGEQAIGFYTEWKTVYLRP